MTDIDTLATEARRWAQGEIAMVEVPEAERVMSERRRRHQMRNGIAAVAIVAVLGVGAAVAANNGGTPKPDVAVAPVGDRAVLRFRPVLGEIPYKGGANTCENGKAITPASGDIATANVVLPDVKRESCLALGPVAMDGTSLADVEAVVNPQSASYELEVAFSNDDFVTKVGKPLVGERVAIVVDGVVYSSPMVNPGITGRTVQVTGDFTKDEARQLAAALRGVDVSEVADPCPNCSR